MIQEQNIGGTTPATGSEGSVIDTLLRFFIGGGMAFIISVLLLMALSAAISAGWVSPQYFFQYTIAVCAVAAFVAVKLTSRFFGDVGILGGVVIGIVFFLLLLLVGYVAFSSMSAVNGGLGLSISSVLGSTLGAVPLPAVKKRGRNRRK